jgi:hypothetical protein
MVFQFLQLVTILSWGIMQLIKKIIYLLFFIFLSHSCIEPFVPNISDYDEMLLIEGLITDNPEIPARVSISLAVPLENVTNPGDPVGSNAAVKIVSDDGSEYLLTETSTGVYEDIDSTIELSHEKRYKLIIETIDGEIFESDFESYRSSPPIDSITYFPEEQVLSELQTSAEGLQFYAHSTSMDERTLYLRWILDATYQYSVPYISNFIWDGNSREEFISDSLLVCWKDENINGIYIGDSYGLTQNRITYAPLNFVSQIGDRLMAKYSLHVVQLAISESAYKFWYNLNKLINETGGLYETQPFKLEGNIRCTSNPDLNVTGVFEVAGVSETRIFVRTPTEFVVYPTHCQFDTLTLKEQWDALRPGSYLYAEPEDGLFLTAPDYCFDCRERGGTLKRPPFWE